MQIDGVRIWIDLVRKFLGSTRSTLQSPVHLSTLMGVDRFEKNGRCFPSNSRHFAPAVQNMHPVNLGSFLHILPSMVCTPWSDNCCDQHEPLKFKFHFNLKNSIPASSMLRSSRAYMLPPCPLLTAHRPNQGNQAVNPSN